ncbi:hypothetical protein [Desulfovulcanus sp.]
MVYLTLPVFEGGLKTNGFGFWVEKKVVDKILRKFILESLPRVNESESNGSELDLFKKKFLTGAEVGAKNFVFAGTTVFDN